jgi:hypothetical protein
MIAQFVLRDWWIPALLWGAVYTSDLMLTLAGARLYKRFDGRFFRFDSYELTPMWKATIERGRAFTPRFALALLASTALVGLLGWSTSQLPGPGEPALLFGLGALFLTETAVHLRHLRNLYLFRLLVSGKSGVEGLIHYPAAFSYRISAWELATLAALFALIAAVEESFFWSGGAVATGLLALRHGRWAKAQA